MKRYWLLYGCLLLVVLFSFIWYSMVTLQQASHHIEGQSLGERILNKMSPIHPTVQFTEPLVSHDDKSLLIDETLVKVKLKGIRVFCFITSQEKSLATKVVAVNETWSRRCDGKVFVATTKRVYPGVIDFKVPDGRAHLTEKTIAALRYLYTNHLSGYDWFLKADDDVYIIMENLKYLLSHYNHREPVYLGHLFKKYSKWGYMSGGASYLLSREALRMVVEKGYNVQGKCAKTGTDEDVELGHCLHAVGITVHDTRDQFNRETFHPFSASNHIIGPIPNGLPDWDRHPTRVGHECCSQLTISFHYTDPSLMRIMEFLLYRTSVYGRLPNFNAMKNFFKIGTVPPLNV
ncbi:glycoprotein-N-acetylgalactosamine 3-beta-galactosyltransferase 1-like [Gigantopelta aegis]|uniref:glycoprotein-N-acetylgalactosamine 3-beta-galactosyltransferase 1-like n=1 Tax=Gigantopelta aegis TaxID=1735272 RepID=UPI001B8894AA|nr:glycoprotein-N-acetylgalactosamine 3-beta-galactosyltransferase 1-like [Gigantopelta aegis]